MADKKIIDEALKFVQECLSSNPVIILGSGHSAGFGIPGVAKLTEYLKLYIPPEVSAKDKVSWKELEKALEVLHLEEALEKVNISPELTDLIIKKTWECIFPADAALLHSVVSSPTDLPLTRLYHHLFRSTQKRVAVITTNYDRLAEYAADLAGHAWTTRFGHGYIGNRYPNVEITVLKNIDPFRMIDIWKVHGSLDWYRRKDGAIFFLPGLNQLPKDFTPVIVTPGIEKYRRTYDEPFRTIIAGADVAIDSGNSFFCVGFGFNDEHIQPKLLEKCRRHGLSIVILTKELTPSAKKYFLGGECRNFIAFEQSPSGTRMFSSKYLGGIELSISLWTLKDLLKEVL